MLPAVISDIERRSAESDTEVARIFRRTRMLAVLVFGIFGSWAAFATITGALIAPGFIVVEDNAKVVQHLTGGTVEALLVREGAVVEAGAPLIRLDRTQVQSQLQILQGQIDEMTIRQARLDASRRQSNVIVLPPEIEARRAIPSVARVIDLESILLETSQRTFDGQSAQLRERLQQVEEEAKGLNEQLGARESQVRIIGSELRDLESLLEKNLVPRSRVTALQRERARLLGDIGSFTADLARGRARMSELRHQLLSLEQSRQNEMTQEARETASKLSELMERRIAVEDTLRNIEIRSPVAGTVHQLNVTTIGGVIRPGEALMKIVPANPDVVVEVRIQPRDIDQVRVGQAANVHLMAANQPTTLSLEGTLVLVAPDITVEPATQLRYFLGRVKVKPESLVRANVPRIIPGMPTDVFIRTEERTPLSYFVRPLVDQAARAFRER
jgi:HlyD family secretion protein